MRQSNLRSRWILALIVAISAVFSLAGLQSAGTLVAHGGHALAGEIDPPAPSVFIR